MKPFAIATSLIILGTLVSCPKLVHAQNTASSVSASSTKPASFFRSVIQQIQNELPDGLVMRLPASMPNTNGLRPEVFSSNDYLAVIFALSQCPSPVNNSCNMGRIFVTKLNTESRNWLEENRQNGEVISLREGVRGFYSPGIAAARGYTPSLIWQQNGMVYGVMLYSGNSVDSSTRQILIDIAASMAK